MKTLAAVITVFGGVSGVIAVVGTALFKWTTVAPHFLYVLSMSVVLPWIVLLIFQDRGLRLSRMQTGIYFGVCFTLKLYWIFLLQVGAIGNEAAKWNQKLHQNDILTGSWLHAVYENNSMIVNSLLPVGWLYWLHRKQTKENRGRVVNNWAEESPDGFSVDSAMESIPMLLPSIFTKKTTMGYAVVVSNLNIYISTFILRYTKAIPDAVANATAVLMLLWVSISLFADSRKNRDIVFSTSYLLVFLLIANGAPSVTNFLFVINTDSRFGTTIVYLAFLFLMQLVNVLFFKLAIGMSNRFAFSKYMYLVQIFEDIYSDLFFLGIVQLDIWFFLMAFLQFGRIIARDLGWFEMAWNMFLDWNDPTRVTRYTEREILRKRLYHNRKYLLFSFTDLLTEYFSVVIVVLMAVTDYYWGGEYCSIACGIKTDEQMGQVLISYGILFCMKLFANWIVHRQSAKTTMALEDELWDKELQHDGKFKVSPAQQSQSEESEIIVLKSVNGEDSEWEGLGEDVRSFLDFEDKIPGLGKMRLSDQVEKVRDCFLYDNLGYFVVCTAVAVTSGIWASARK